VSGYCNDCGNQHCVCDIKIDNHSSLKLEVRSVFKFGDKVEITLLELYGYITAICYRGDYVTYEVSFFSNGEYHQVWFDGFEINEM